MTTITTFANLATMRCLRITVLMAVLLSGCALAPKLEAPTLDVIGVEMLPSDLFQQRLKLTLRVQNPNDRELPVKGVTTDIEIQGEKVASGVSGAQFTVPALGEAEFDMIVTASMATALIKMLGRKGGEHTDQIDYRVTGKVSLASGLLRSIPFSETGTLKLQ